MLFLCFFLSFGLLTYAQSPGLLGDFPLAVKTPYLHGWIQNTNRKAPEQVWPQLFAQGHILGWNAMIRVDDQPYQWLGNSNIVNFSTTLSSEITPTSTIFTIQAGPMKFKATFLTPIEPNDYTRQSIPFTYLFVDGFAADDGNPHTIQLYSDISGEFISHDKSTQMKWDTQDSPENMIYHHLEPRDPMSMYDNADSAEDATAYYATPKRPGLTWQTGADTDCRTKFAQDGNLTNVKDTNFRPVGSNWPVFSFAIDLGSVTPTNQPDPVVWALGLVRDPLVNYDTTGSGTFQLRTGYYWSAYNNIDDVISDFLKDFASARVRGRTFDDGILKEASAISPEYAGILSLVTRQIFASMDITIPASERGRTSPSDVKIFMKDISVSKRANPVEVIYAALPALLYFNPSLAHDLLLPLFEFQSSSSYPNGYASPDLGIGYPTISGNTSATEELAIEHCGNMLIMAYAHAAKSGDDSLISKYHSLLQRWADYLVQNSLHPNNAISADGISYPEMSNLALKGILGAYFMGKIDEVINPSNTTFKDKANELIQNWKQFAVTDTHIQAEYGKPGTWGLMYNLFPAVWLQTGLIDDEILNREAQFYLSKAPPGEQSYSLDNGAGRDIAYPHWSLMTAAIIPSGFNSVRDTLIQSTYFQAYNVSQNFPLPMRYTASTGVARFGTTGSAAHGAAFGILAMKLKNVEISHSNSGGSGNVEKKTPPVGPIVGGVIGGLAFFLIVAAAIFFWRRRRVHHLRGVIDLHDEGHSKPHPFITQYAPVNNNGSAFQSPQQSADASLPPSTWQGSLSEPFSEPQYSGRSHSDASGRNNSSVTPTPPITATQPLSTKQREILRQNHSHQSQPSVSAVSTLTNPWSAAGSGREEVLRAEVDELRREMEAIRNMAQPPPSYQ